MANLRRRGRQLLRLGLLLFNTIAVICIFLTKQIVRDDLAKPSYHLNENAEYLADFRPLCKGAASDPNDLANGENRLRTLSTFVSLSTNHYGLAQIAVA